MPHRWWQSSLVGLAFWSFARFACAQADTSVSADGPDLTPPAAEPAATPAPAPAPPAPAPAASTASAPAPPANTAAGPPLSEANPWISPDMPRTLPYYTGATTPPGYTFQSRLRWGLLVPGALLFSVGYAIAISATRDEEYAGDYWLYVPLVGPWGAFIVKSGRCESEDEDPECDLGDRIEEAPLEFISLLFQTPGAGLLIAGFVPKKRFVRNDLAWLGVTPVALRGGVGIRAFGEF